MVLPYTWKLDGGLNFSLLALVGHMMMTLPESSWTPLMRSCAPAYREPIGGCSNLKDYDGRSSARSGRATSLQQWAADLGPLFMTLFQAACVRVFPHLIQEDRATAAKRTLAAVLFAPVASAQSAVHSMVSSMISYELWKIILPSLVVFAVSIVVLKYEQARLDAGSRTT
jgi:hypothetical protein